MIWKSNCLVMMNWACCQYVDTRHLVELDPTPAEALTVALQIETGRQKANLLSGATTPYGSHTHSQWGVTSSKRGVPLHRPQLLWSKLGMVAFTVNGPHNKLLSAPSAYDPAHIQGYKSLWTANHKTVMYGVTYHFQSANCLNEMRHLTRWPLSLCSPCKSCLCSAPPVWAVVNGCNCNPRYRKGRQAAERRCSVLFLSEMNYL